ncbi:MAG: MarR family transcriptional regulator [Flavobacteriales bacterium]|nr:MarR family transcriptional regulator [Flavobacteriales bacterium]MCX7768105.1 MarR family transcriptional regulator [Flavobacteriales bacterium]MDW8409603.1 MarR family transcriptional regulator [Flavobacteriales bacterium]
MKKQETVDFNVKYTWHLISRMYNEVAQKHGLTAASGFVLLNIDPQNGTPATKIAPLLGMESRSLTRMLKNLEKRRLIVRKPDKNDKRLVMIHLTPEGKKKREIAKLTVKHFNNYLKITIPEYEFQIFFKVLQKINYLIENKKILF